MSLLKTVLLLAVALLAVFVEAVWDTPRNWLGAQIDLLPGLMVYASLTAGVTVITLLAVVGGLGFDSLSANPCGASVLPLLVIGLVIHRWRHLILRDQPYAQWVLGLGASAAAPVLTLLVLGTMGLHPILSLGSVWQGLVLGLGGAAFTPLYFRLFDRLQRALGYHPFHETSFRPDREIERGRH
jgi:rod shape-determining protein MreD